MGCSKATSTVFTVPPYKQQGQPPAVPTNVRQTRATTGSVTVAWDAVSGATSYYYVDSDNYHNTIPGTSTTLSDLSPGQSITFQVRAQNQYGNSAFSSPVTLTAQAPIQKPGTPGAPYQCGSGTVAQSPTQASLEICWTPGSGATSQDLIDPVSGQVLVSGLAPTYNNYIIPNLYAGATTHVAVRANNSAGSTTGPSTPFTLPCPAGYKSTGGGCQQIATQANIGINSINVNSAVVGQYVNVSVILNNYGNGTGSVQVTGTIIDPYGVCNDSPGATIGHFNASSYDNVAPGQTVSVDMVSEGPVAACYAGTYLEFLFRLSNGVQKSVTTVVSG